MSNLQSRSMFIVHTESSHGWGGQEIRILTESKELLRLGHQVLLLADPDSLIYQRSSTYGIPRKAIPLKRKRLRELINVQRTLRDLKPDIVITHSSTDHWVVAVARLFLGFKPRIVRTRHVSAAVSRNITTRWLYNRGCEAIVTTGESIRQSLVCDGFVAENKVVSIPTGIDLDHFKPGNRQQARAGLGLGEKTLVFGNVGTLRSWKGQLYLIEAFAKLKLPNSILLIVGDGPMREALKRRVCELDISSSVIMAGHQQDVRPYLDAMDIFVFPSFANEGVPQAILQAIAYSLPIITTDAGSILEAVHDIPHVKIVTKRDAHALASVMAEVAASEVARERTTAIPSGFAGDIETMATRVDALYQTTKNFSQRRLSAYLIGNPDTPSTKRRFEQFKPALLESFELTAHYQCKRVPWYELIVQPDILFIQKAIPTTFFWLCIRPLLKSRVIFDFDDAIWLRASGNWSVFARIRKAIRFRLAIGCADRITCSSEFLKNAAKIPERKACVIPMCVEDPLVEQTRPEDQLYGCKKVLCIGWAGHPQSHYLIEEVDQDICMALEKFPGLSFYILSGAKPKVSFPFVWLPFSEANEQEFFRTTDIGIVPISRSNFDQCKSPIKIIQHFSYGRPVITNGIGATLEIANHKNSILIKDFSELSSVLALSIDNERKTKNLAINALTSFRDRFSLDASAHLLIRVLKN